MRLKQLPFYSGFLDIKQYKKQLFGIYFHIGLCARVKVCQGGPS